MRPPHRPSALFRLPLLAALAGLAAALTALAAPPPAPAAKPPAKSGPVVFEACRHGCPHRGIQAAVEAAGAYAFRHRRAKVTVAIRPGRYAEGVVLDAGRRRRRYRGMTIEGTTEDPRRVILEGGGSRGASGAAQNGIEAIGVDGLVLRSIWARGYPANGFFVHSAREGARPCGGYTMDNLLVSGNGSHGLFAQGCSGGRMTDSAAYRQGDSAFAVAETPCDDPHWNAYGGRPCQSKPRWTLLKGDQGHESALGFSGTNARYVRVVENAFFDNGTGVLLETLDGAGQEPNAWNMIERNDVFWNDYNPFLAGSKAKPVVGGLGEAGGRPLGYPTGVGIAVHGGDGDVVRGNHVFGNYKWGIASFSGPGESLAGNRNDEAKNVNNEFFENAMGRGGADPNGEYDFFNDATGGGNCWGDNSPNATFALGNGKLAPGRIYPVCPQAKVGYADPAVASVNPEAGLQTNQANPGSPRTILGYASTSPPQDQQCSWVRRVASHPPFQRFKPVEVKPRPGELTC